MPKNRPPFLAVAAGYGVSAGGGAVAASIYSSGQVAAGALVQVAAMKAGQETTKYVAQQMKK